jgi:hypothetical protein
MEPPIEFEKVSFDDAKKALDTKVADDKVKGYPGERAPEHGEPLLESTKRWLNELPASVRPDRDGQGFSANRQQAGRVVEAPVALRRVFQTLLLDKRGGRKGFPRP